jgi:hypothetical protein
MLYFQILALLVTLSIHSLLANSRSPAVEDFVGIEVNHPSEAPQGTDALFNFEKDIQQFNAQNSTSSPSGEGWNLVAVILVFFLPIIVWALMIHSLRQRAKAERASNIEIFEKYRQDREKARKSEEDIRKAS